MAVLNLRASAQNAWRAYEDGYTHKELRFFDVRAALSPFISSSFGARNAECTAYAPIQMPSWCEDQHRDTSSSAETDGPKATVCH